MGNKVKCLNCMGSGRCPVCKGSGSVKTIDLHPSPNLIDEDTGEVKCFGCLGKKYCMVCNGEGKVEQ
jgi:hypothetical protein